MDRLMTVALLLCAAACCALAQSNTSTAVPTPTSTLLPSPSVAPLPSPTPIISRAHWSFQNGSAVCVAMDAEINIHITYLNTTNKKTTLIETVDNSSYVDNGLSYCNHLGCFRHINTTLLTIAWDSGRFTFGFKFEKNMTDNRKWGLSQLNLTFSTDNLTNYMNSSEFPMVEATRDSFFKGVQFNQSYQCNHSNTYTLDTETQGTIEVQVTILDLRAQAFYFNNTEGDYGDAYVCVQDHQPSKVAPIVVGVVLGFLAVVVLIGYIAGRVWTWSQQRKAKYEMLS